MKKQKICIIGGGLTALATAISLSKLNCNIDLVIGNTSYKTKNNRSIAISQNNLNFLKSLNLNNSFKKNVWACSSIKLFTELKNEKFSEILEFNKSQDKRKIFYMIENKKIIKLMLKKIKKNKLISVIKNKKISKIENFGSLKAIKFNNSRFKYNLIIVCAGYNSEIVKNIFKNQTIESNYKEVSVTAILEHDQIKNNVARQIFLKEGVFALLPLSRKKTSIVYSVKKEKINNEINLKKKIKKYAEFFYKKTKFLGNTESRNLNFLVRNKYFKDRVLLFGDALHVLHPFVGQGFNMILRDLYCLENILIKKIQLGLDIGSKNILSEFSEKTKPRNLVFSLGVDFLKNSLSNKNFRDNSFKILNKNNFLKKILLNIANEGIKF